MTNMPNTGSSCEVHFKMGPALMALFSLLLSLLVPFFCNWLSKVSENIFEYLFNIFQLSWIYSNINSSQYNKVKNIFEYSFNIKKYIRYALPPLQPGALPVTSSITIRAQSCRTTQSRICWTCSSPTSPWWVSTCTRGPSCKSSPRSPCWTGQPTTTWSTSWALSWLVTSLGRDKLQTLLRFSPSTWVPQQVFMMQNGHLLSLFMGAELYWTQSQMRAEPN